MGIERNVTPGTLVGILALFVLILLCLLLRLPAALDVSFSFSSFLASGLTVLLEHIALCPDDVLFVCLDVLLQAVETLMPRDLHDLFELPSAVSQVRDLRDPQVVTLPVLSRDRIPGSQLDRLYLPKEILSEGVLRIETKDLACLFLSPQLKSLQEAYSQRGQEVGSKLRRLPNRQVNLC